MSETNKPQLQPTSNPARQPGHGLARRPMYWLILLAAGCGFGISVSGIRVVPVPQAAASRPAAGSATFSNRSQCEGRTGTGCGALLEAVNKNPTDFDMLVKLGNLYYDGQQFPSAIQFYERALVIHPDNPDVRTDMGTAYWYTGNADKALSAMEIVFEIQAGPSADAVQSGLGYTGRESRSKGAIEAWRKLLKTNPDYPQKQQVEQYIAKAIQHASQRIASYEFAPLHILITAQGLPQKEAFLMSRQLMEGAR